MLSIKNVSKAYDANVFALNNVSLDIPTGMFGLLGPNGAGKSSLMRTIATLQQPDSGTITWNGTDIAAELEALRSVLGYLPQDFGVYRGVSATQLLNHFAVLKGITNRSERDASVADVLTKTRLVDLKDRAVHTFSGGMRQRFGIAQALLGSPKLLIIDEPTSGLDPAERFSLLETLAGLSAEVTVILSTHIVQDVMDLCPRMAILVAGRVVYSGSPLEATSEIDGRVWRKRVSPAELSEIKVANTVLSTRLVSGKTEVSVLSPVKPAPHFVLSQPQLEDAYFMHISALASA
jgi:ABC-type multidrug transport system ATPase subunit